MKKKFICTVCGYVHEGDEAPEICPLCKAPRSKFKELNESAALEFVTEHVIGIAKDTDDEMKADLRAHFEGECAEVGMYLAMSRQADREGYPEIAEAFKRYAIEEAEHASKFAELLGECVWSTKETSKSAWLPKPEPMPTRCASHVVPKSSTSMQSMTPFTKWPKTKPATARASRVSTTAISRNKSLPENNS